MSDVDSSSDAAARPRHPGRAGWLLRVIEVRFRFMILLAALLLVFGGWSGLQARFDWLLRKLRGAAPTDAVVSNDTEYFCPMDPGVLSDWPEKCPICQMALVRRKKGDATVLPSGVTSRMQLTPERVQLAGVRTTTAAYLPLARQVTVGGLISPVGDDGGARWVFESMIARDDIPLADQSTSGELTLQIDGLAESSATINSLSLVQDQGDRPPRVRIEIADPDRQLRSGLYVVATLRVPAARFEPFRALAAPPPVLRAEEPRSIYACPNHGDALHEAPGKCPLDQQALVEQKLTDNERLQWWCPMHANVTADQPGLTCAKCNGMRLVPRIIRYAPPGTVLTIPESAVVDFGREQIVYVERMPGMYDGVRVELGPSCAGNFPVVRGVSPGDRVVMAGAFLLDAETRLNPALANSYFGAGSNAGATTVVPEGTGESADDAAPERIKAALAKLAPQERAVAERQGTCPVTGLPLGSMGTPIKVAVEGKEVFVCCPGCLGQLDATELSPKSE